MKKNLIILFSLVVISIMSFTSCEPFIENKITIKNLAEAPVQLNIRAKLYEILPGENLILNDYKKGTFEYETIYSVPLGASTFEAKGDVSGEVVLNAGTEVLLVYTSTFVDEAYTVYGSLTTSDDINRIDPFDDETTGGN